MTTVTLQKRRKVNVKVLYYTCKQCDETPLLHPADREKGICDRCKITKQQTKRKREYKAQKALGATWSKKKKVTNTDIAANIERVVRKAKQAEQVGRAADVFNISPRSLKIQVRGAQKVG